MLYDPKWEAPQVKADPFSLESLVAWLEKMPRDGSYDYCNSTGCILCQYFTAMGFKDVSMDSTHWDHSDHPDEIRLPRRFNSVANGRGPRDWTFGAALERARRAMHR